MGLFDFLKVKKEDKKPAKGKPQIPSKGTATFSGKSDGLLPGMIGHAVFPDSVTKGR